MWTVLIYLYSDSNDWIHERKADNPMIKKLGEDSFYFILACLYDQPAHLNGTLNPFN